MTEWFCGGVGGGRGVAVVVDTAEYSLDTHIRFDVDSIGCWSAKQELKRADMK